MQRLLANRNSPCWLTSLRICLNTCSEGIKKFWSDWWSGGMFETLSYVDNDGSVISLKQSCMYELRQQLSDCFRTTWLESINDPVGKRGEGLNKLRLYAQYKSVVCLEPYLLYIKHDGKRLLLMKFRVGVAPLRIETGRYEANVDVYGANNKRVPRELRICKCCYGGVEDEVHFLLGCPRYVNLRKRLLDKFCMYHTSTFQVPCPTDIKVLFNCIMACQDEIIITELANFLWDAFKIRRILLEG